MTIDEQIADALARCNAAMKAKGYDQARVVFRAGDTYRRWSGHLYDLGTGAPATIDATMCYGDTFAEMVDGTLAKIADLPPRWTPDQVAATLGLVAA